MRKLRAQFLKDFKKQHVTEANGDLMNVTTLILQAVVQNANESIAANDTASIRTLTRWRCNSVISDDLLDKVSKPALNYLMEQTQLARATLLTRPIPLQPCTGTFAKSKGLPCSHTISENLRRNRDWQIPLSLIDEHWLYFRKPVFGPAQDPFRHLREPAIPISQRTVRQPELQGVVLVSPSGELQAAASQSTTTPHGTSSHREEVGFETADREANRAPRPQPIPRQRRARGANQRRGTGATRGAIQRTSDGGVFMTLDL
ncbi:hypothetical protein P152DRAFT_3472 [Eremomyces bilateralis CBS 781.70]|uniref:Uncharacterized protein n=1 Tax=Eremomyces bilateralis CBS 781.70 TaxID=1392243 RepID=A0A6G1GG41_9PEZI|nr:uncharacterized protein P152DRAFT_3472 [Eremomyces bilateralis CBS 781.70]KAF1816896.1 hypothetical protein P152DRAFT_3472 [Eremomyces bilateralis CBS 781.70]